MFKTMTRGPCLALSGVLATAVLGCDTGRLLEVEVPDVVLPGDLGGPTGLASLRAGAIGDFASAYVGNPRVGGGDEGVVLTSGLFTDEYFLSGTFPARREVDRRVVQSDNFVVLQTFSNLQRSRQALETAARRIREENGQDERIGELLGLAAVTYNFFAEIYCSGVPFSNLDEAGNLVPGRPNTTVEVLEIAVATADEALAAGEGNAEFTSLAAVQKGRALLNLGQYALAAQAVANVPTEFSFQTSHSIPNGRENLVYSMNVVWERWSLSNLEGENGLPYRDLNDPRVPWHQTADSDGTPDVGFNNVSPQFNMTKYPGRDAPADVATGTEARLIEAEAALAEGQVGVFVDRINEVRAFLGLGLVVDPGTQSAREDLLFSERALTLFATGHRLGDLRRLIRQYGRAAEEVFPVGTYHRTEFADYGGDVNFPVPFAEQNNEHFTGCLDRGA